MRRANVTAVAGGAGFIGSHLCHALLDRGDEAICVDNLQTAPAAEIRALLPATVRAA